MSAERIIKSLNKWTIDKMDDEYYRFNNINDNDLVLDETLTIKAENLTWQIGNPFNEQLEYLGEIENNILREIDIVY